MRFSALLLPLVSTLALADETNCSVLLTDAGDQKINVIKIVRDRTGLGLASTPEAPDATCGPAACT